jgi:uncharacterized protein
MRTPTGHTITPRDLAFGRQRPHERWWLRGDPVATAFFNALSVTFPLGERFFIDSVKTFRERAGAELQPQIAALIRQEALHTREHVVFNDQMAAHGYDVSRMEQRTRDRLEIARARHPVAMLASTVALEHFTAILANAILSDPRHLEGAAEEARRLWTWHAIEEIEHKSVAYDTYLAVMVNQPVWRRWWVRVLLMTISTWHFARNTKRNLADIFEQDGIRNGRTWRRTLSHLLVKPGILRRVLPGYLAFYLPGWHPWNHDDRPLLKRAEASLAPA